MFHVLPGLNSSVCAVPELLPLGIPLPPPRREQILNYSFRYYRQQDEEVTSTESAAGKPCFYWLSFYMCVCVCV